MRLTAPLRTLVSTLAADDVRVELYAEPANGAAHQVITLSHYGAVPGPTSGFIYRGQLRGSRPESVYTARVVPARDGVRVPAETALIHWQR